MSNAVIAGYARTPFHFARKGKLASVSAYPEGEQGSKCGTDRSVAGWIPRHSGWRHNQSFLRVIDDRSPLRGPSRPARRLR
jgi:hypothetical protein